MRKIVCKFLFVRVSYIWFNRIQSVIWKMEPDRVRRHSDESSIYSDWWILTHHECHLSLVQASFIHSFSLHITSKSSFSDSLNGNEQRSWRSSQTEIRRWWWCGRWNVKLPGAVSSFERSAISASDPRTSSETTAIERKRREKEAKCSDRPRPDHCDAASDCCEIWTKTRDTEWIRSMKFS